MKKVIEILELEKSTLNDLIKYKVSDEADYQIIDEIEQDLQLLQSCVSKSVCKHCNNKLCDSQTFNEQCFKCGKKPL